MPPEQPEPVSQAERPDPNQLDFTALWEAMQGCPCPDCQRKRASAPEGGAPVSPAGQ
jgi:hypothetical protein